MEKPRLLVAGTPPAIETIRRLFGAEAVCWPASSLDDAIRRLEAHPDAILCNVRFDESRMFELLQYVKALPEYKEVPVICVQCMEVALADAVLKNMDDAVKALGGTAFVDLRDHVMHFRSQCDFLARLASQSTRFSPN